MAGGPARSAKRPGGAALGHLAALVAGALLVPALAGCGGDEDRDEATTKAAQSVSTSERSELRKGGTVRWAIDALPATLNAFQFDADPVTDRVAGAVLPSLFTVDGEGRPQLNPDYLRSAEITDREPKQKVVYTLNPKAKWSDGRAIGAADFTAQWKALNGEDHAFWSARNAGYERIHSIRKGPGAHQVEVTFDRPYADWKSLFTPLYPRSVTGDADRFNDGTRTELPAAAGPFEVEEVDEEGQTVTLRRNDAWWGDEALLDELVFTVVPADERRAALSAGELDVAEVQPAVADRITAAQGPQRRGGKAGAEGRRGEDPEGTGAGKGSGAGADASGTAEDPEASGPGEQGEQGSQGEQGAQEGSEGREEHGGGAQAGEGSGEGRGAPGRPGPDASLRGYTVHRAYAASATQLALNGASDELSDERVRWAIARALDRERLAAAAHDPAGLPAKPLGSHLRLLGQAGYRDNSDALGSPGAEAAEDLLEKAGWHRQAGGPPRDGKPGAGSPVRAKEGKPLQLDFVLPEGPGTAPLRRVGERIVSMLAQIGIAAKIKQVDEETYFSEHIAAGNYDLALFAWPATAYPATDFLPLFAKPQAIPGGEMLIQQNYSRVGTDYIDQLLGQAAGELDEKAHNELLNKADARIWAAAGSIPLYQRPQLVAARAQLSGVGAFGMQTPRYQDIGYRR
ncbi:ABC transporter family substrate-binding protein [Streptomyces hoynatensis]|uniref:ABC transporter family substrate-binding protein n=1 Tax=Streptomyces hoynatensis TaxID=1141874 RepID=A0A3A9ZFG7_9ACTN|nr:ABC transporter family substrate-binding protein [Streptomyces hoynatensis]RKN47053.1 ABC transporter family substrate-binding protein [Streptomyces hoynatensis]